MKKICMFVALLNFSSCYAASLCPNRSEGFMEMGLGYGSIRSSVGKAEVANGNLAYPLTRQGYLYKGTTDIASKARQKGFLSSFSFGYNANFKGSPLMVGFIAGAHIGSVNGRIKAPIIVKNNATNQESYYDNHYTRLRTKFGAQIAARLGVWWCDHLPFVKIGWACIRTSFKSPTGCYPVKDYPVPVWFKGTRRFFNGLVLGLGWDMVVSDHCAVGVAADFTFYKRKNCSFFKDDYSVIVGRTRPTGFSLMATLKYLLPERKGF